MGAGESAVLAGSITFKDWSYGLDKCDPLLLTWTSGVKHWVLETSSLSLLRCLAQKGFAKAAFVLFPSVLGLFAQGCFSNLN